MVKVVKNMRDNEESTIDKIKELMEEIKKKDESLKYKLKVRGLKNENRTDMETDLLF